MTFRQVRSGSATSDTSQSGFLSGKLHRASMASLSSPFPHVHNGASENASMEWIASTDQQKDHIASSTSHHSSSEKPPNTYDARHGLDYSRDSQLSHSDVPMGTSIGTDSSPVQDIPIHAHISPRPQQMYRSSSSGFEQNTVQAATSPRSPGANANSGFVVYSRPSSSRVSGASPELPPERRKDGALSDTSSQSTAGRSRRSSSVFEQVGGMLDRFGKRLHSRSEIRDPAKKTSSVLSLTGVGSTMGDLNEAVSLDDDVSWVMSKISSH